jgi:nucleotide-binding universal stress UspA family protein
MTSRPKQILVATDFSPGSDEAMAAAVDFATRAGAAGVACRTKMVEGLPATEIVQRAREIGADLIVIGTHGRRGIAHVVLGSVAERVVQHAPCPVLTVPVPRKAA